MRTTKKRIDSSRELMLAFAFCLWRKQYREELIGGRAYPESVWKRVGVSRTTLRLARKVVEENKKCFVSLNQSIHACMLSSCPDPPCPDDGLLADLVSAWSNRPDRRGD